MKTLKLKFSLFAAALMITSAGLFAQSGEHNCHKAQEQKCMHEKHEGCMNKIPNLTEEQKTSIEKLKTQHMKVMMTLKNELNEKNAHLKTVSNDENVDMNAVNKTIDEIGAIKVKMMKEKVAHKQEVRKLLNDEQKVFFDAHMMKKDDCCMGGHGERHQGMHGKMNGEGPHMKDCPKHQ